MRKFIALLIIALAIAFAGCVSEKPTKNVEKTAITPTQSPTEQSKISEYQIPINDTDISQLMNYMNEIDNISFNI